MLNKVMSLTRNIFIIFVGLVIVTGCAVRFGGSSGSTEDVVLDEQKTSEHGLIYGKINIQGNDYLEYVTLQRKGKVYAGMGAAGRGESVRVTLDGTFIAENLLPGDYRIVELTLHTTHASLHEYADKFTVRVKPGKVQYAGTYEYKSLKKGGIGYAGTFSIKNVSSKKSRNRALETVKLTAKGTKWLQLLK